MYDSPFSRTLYASSDHTVVLPDAVNRIVGRKAGGLSKLLKWALQYRALSFSSLRALVEGSYH